MSRNEGKIGTGDEVAVDATKILAEIQSRGAEGRPTAVARYLSGAEGWKEALDLLGGAFAPRGRNKDG